VNDLVNDYAPQARKYALQIARKHRYYAPGDEDDLQSEAIVGLMRAAKKYDPARGVAFWHYAQFWVNAHVGAYIRWRMSGPATVSTHLTRNGGPRRPRTFGVSLSQEIDDLERAPSSKSERLLYSHGHTTPDTGAESEIDSTLDNVWTVARRVLTPDQYAILEERHRDGRLLHEIGDARGVTRERIRQILVDAVERIQLALAREGARE
jgi:RNA polymerase sigma factor (sigma-70 family)